MKRVSLPVVSTLFAAVPVLLARGSVLLACSVLLTFGPATVLAQSWPAKPLRFVVNSGPGGPSDFVARGMSQVLPQTLGQPVVVENRIGAAGIIGADAVAKAAPDGYTVLMTVSAPITLNQYFYTSLPYDPVKDLAPVSLVSAINSIYFAHPSLPANTMPELIALARAKPDSILYGSWGVGSFPDLYRAWLENQFNVKFRHIPYKEASQVTAALLSGEVQVLLNPAGLLAPQVRSGRLKTIATIGFRRASNMPEVPSFKDLGYDLDFLGWVGAFAPGATPREIVLRLNTEMGRLIADPAFGAKYLAPQSMDPRGGTPEEFAAFIKVDRETAGKLARLAGVKPE
jgi:tripartite-type tricarboxylate transporter receptor subunit TctC